MSTFFVLYLSNSIRMWISEWFWLILRMFWNFWMSIRTTMPNNETAMLYPMIDLVYFRHQSNGRQSININRKSFPFHYNAHRNYGADIITRHTANHAVGSNLKRWKLLPSMREHRTHFHLILLLLGVYASKLVVKMYGSTWKPYECYGTMYTIVSMGNC